MKKRNPYIGRTVDKALHEQMKDADFRKAYLETRAELDLVREIKSIMVRKKIGLRALARLMRTSISQVQRLTDEQIKSFNVDTLVRFAVATGTKLQIGFGL